MSGMPAGRLIDPNPPPRWRAVADLFRLRRVPSADAVRRFRRAFLGGRGLGPPVRLATSVHTLTVAPPGAGKSTGVALPFLRTCPDGMAVLDVKGELFRGSAAHRRALGHAVHAIDPWGVVTRDPARINPFDWEDPGDPGSLDFVRDLAESVVVRNLRDEAHWPDMAEAFIGGAAAAVLNFSPPERCHLETVANVLAYRHRLEETVDALKGSPAWGGALARMGHVMSHAGKEEMESILSTSNRMLRFLTSPAAADSLRASTFDPGDLARGKCTVFVIVPAVHLRPMAGWVRLVPATLHRAVLKRGAGA